MQIAVAIFLFHLVLAVHGKTIYVTNSTYEVYVQHFILGDSSIPAFVAAAGNAISSKWIITSARMFYSLEQTKVQVYPIEEYVVVGGAKEIMKFGPRQAFPAQDYRQIKNYYILDPRNAPTVHPFAYSIALLELNDPLHNVEPIDVYKGDIASERKAQLEIHTWKRCHILSGKHSIYKLVNETQRITYLTSGQMVIETKFRKMISPHSSFMLGAGFIDNNKLVAIVGPQIKGFPRTFPVLEIDEHWDFIYRKVLDKSDGDLPSESSGNELDDIEYYGEIHRGVMKSSFQAFLFCPAQKCNVTSDIILFATIIDLKWILTQAEPIHKQNATHFVVQAGSRLCIQESSEQAMECSQKYIPKEYSENGPNRFLYNFALIELKDAFEKTSALNPINIFRGNNLDGVNVTAYFILNKQFGKVEYHPLIGNIGEVKKETHEGKEILGLTVPWRNDPVSAYSVAYRGELIGITGGTIGKTHALIEMQNHLKFIMDTTGISRFTEG